MLAPLQRLYAVVHGALHLVVREGMKFGVVGAVAYVVDFGVFNLLLHAGPDPVLDGRPLTAKVVSVCLATLTAWVGNRYWTFRRRRRSAVRRELVLFAVVNVGGLLLALVPLAVSRYVLGLTSAVADNIAANVVGLALGTLFRFLMYRTVVFNELRDGEPGAPGGPTGGAAAGTVTEGAAVVEPGVAPQPASSHAGSRFSTNAAMPSTRSAPPTT
ncbi:GtrA family protein [Aquipuribacter sp. SD81]|uniref:GtrA family protein n=1 Tax=Aquipuribacter sp. SD81 TaxID=3127703 RepID=UPI00301756ED